MKLKTLKFKNFLSYGNNLTVFDFEKSDIVSIYGRNGFGKSSLLDALYFVLTGKPLRNVSKSKLVNSINKKDCCVELEFDVNGNSYVVKRGIKPNLFEIYKNDNLIDEESHVKDYQKVLEQITNLNTKTIEQILIISNRFYKPFLDLSAADKRSFVESIFGVDVLSDIVDNVKVRLRSVKEKESMLDKDIERVESNIKLLKEHNSNNRVDVSELQRKIKSNEDVIDDNNKDVQVLTKELSTHEENRNELKQQLKREVEAHSKKSKCESEIERFNIDIATITENDVCSRCGQSIPKDQIDERVNECKAQIDLWEARLDKLNVYIKKLNKIKERLEVVESNIDKIKSKIQSLNSNSRELEVHNSNMKSNINSQSKMNSDFTNKIKKLDKQKDELEKDTLETVREKNAILTLQKLLSEKGLRKFILNKYIALLNKTLNDNLAMLSASYQIKFDDEFKEQLVGKVHDKLDCGSLSSGEKQRLDLSIMFAFLEVAKMKNNLNVNLLAFDEMFGDLDEDGLNGIREVFNDMKSKGNHVLLITHDERIKNMSDINYEVKKNKFSKIERV